MAFVTRKLAWTPIHGVFLGFNAEGKTIWSKDKNLTGKEKAPTFVDDAHFRAFAVESHSQELLNTTGIVLRDVYPRDHKSPFATMQDCMDVGVASWADKEKK